MIYVQFLFNLLSTILIEGIVIAVLFRKLEFAYYSMLCNLLTNPALNLVFLAVVSFRGAACYGAVLVISEIIALFIEAYILMLLCQLPFFKANIQSGLLNLLSCAAGLLIYGTVALL